MKVCRWLLVTLFISQPNISFGGDMTLSLYSTGKIANCIQYTDKYETLKKRSTEAVQRGDYEKALQYEQQIKSIKDSIYAKEMAKTLSDFSTQMGNDELERQAADRERMLKEVEITNHLLQAENAQMETQNAKLDAEKAILETNQAKLEANQANLNAQKTSIQTKQAKLKAAKDLEESIRKKNLAKQEIQMQEEERRLKKLERLTLEKKQLESKKRSAETEAKSGYLKNLNILMGAFLLATSLITVVLVVYYWRRQRTISEQMALRKDLIAAKSIAEKASKMKDLFIQNMSHDIRTPLNAVMGFSQILCAPGLPLSSEEKQLYGKHISNNAKLLLLLIDDIMNISDIESGNYKIVRREHRCNAICETALSVAENRVPAGVELKFTSDVSDDYQVYTDARRIQQVLVNYLTNACKHTTTGSIILHCTNKYKKGDITFSVTDTGEGIPPAEAEKIFERFTKLNLQAQGSGIGLNICQNIAKRMSGRVWLDTKYTTGARFMFSVPSVKDNSEER